jgi:hypothetical protein
MGNAGGIPVNKELKSGVKNPTNMAYGTLRKKPARRTGMCMGRNMDPAPPNA